MVVKRFLRSDGCRSKGHRRIGTQIRLQAKGWKTRPPLSLVSHNGQLEANRWDMLCQYMEVSLSPHSWTPSMYLSSLNSSNPLWKLSRSETYFLFLTSPHTPCSRVGYFLSTNKQHVLKMTPTLFPLREELVPGSPLYCHLVLFSLISLQNVHRDPPFNRLNPFSLHLYQKLNVITAFIHKFSLDNLPTPFCLL